MLRGPLLYLSNAGWSRRLITRFPIARRMASRFVAGETPDDAIIAIRALNSRGINATLDHLGESVTSQAAAARAADDYVLVLGKIQASGTRSNVSIKLTQLGLDLDEEFCVRNARRVVEEARRLDNFVRIDMEDSLHTDGTIAVFRKLHQEFDNVGLVVQAYLYRTEADLQILLAGERGTRIRLCKGAYKEPPDKAFPRKADVDANYVRLSKLLLDNARKLSPAAESGRVPPLPALATHDEKMIKAAEAYVVSTGLPRQYFEFQMLYGIRRDLQQRLAGEGYRMRVYVPYGTEWYPYFMRRLAERPANVWFLLSNLVRN
jgi:proline dehydrogenase